jgi:hypothetical protein
LSGLQIGKNSRNGLRPRVTPVSQVEHEARIAHHIPTETGGGDVTLAQKLFDFIE